MSLTPVLISVLIASLLGSFHCAAMCGGFVCYAAGEADRRYRSLMAYNFGRGLAYLFLGGLAGMLGEVMNLGGETFGFQQVAGLVCGILLVVWGVRKFRTEKEVHQIGDPQNGLTLTRGLFSKIVSTMPQGSAVQRALTIGTVSALLPCGWLYAYVAVAATTADAASGMLVMLAFWIGTVPVLFLCGTVFQVFTTPLKRYLPRLTAALLVVAGMYSLASHLWPTSHHHHPVSLHDHH